MKRKGKPVSGRPEFISLVCRYVTRSQPALASWDDKTEENTDVRCFGLSIGEKSGV